MKDWLLKKMYRDKVNASADEKYKGFLNNSSEVKEDFKKNSVNIINDLSDISHLTENRKSKKVVDLAKKWIIKIEDPLVKSVLIDGISNNEHYEKDIEFEKNLLKEYELVPIGEFDRKNSIANFFIKNYRDELFGPIKNIIEREKGEEHGRPLLILSLGKSQLKETEDFLIELLVNNDSINSVIKALGELKSKKSLKLIESYITSKDKYTQKTAQKAIKKIEE